MKTRRGVTILEVLFAIGVVAIGLLGVMSVLPIALDQAGRGHVSERVARLGQNAEEEFFSRDMFRVSQWAVPFVRPPAQLSQTHWGSAVTLVPGAIYCLDPQFVVTNVAKTVVGPNMPPNPAPNFSKTLNPDIFPYAVDMGALSSPATAYPVISRITLRTPPFPADPARSIDILRQATAEQIFSLDDELAFDQPAEKTLPPTQQFGAGAKRQSEGNYTWFATIAPVTTVIGTVSDSYYLSIVVVHRRNRNFPLTEHNESLATIPETYFHIDGYHGGDVTMVGSLAEELDVKPGHWVMLMRNVGAAQWARWYRVVGADVAPNFNTTTSLWELDVSLEGPDWPVDKVSVTPPPPTRVAIIRGASEVFERTVRLE